MKNINHLAPILRFFFPGLYIVCCRGSGKNLIFFNLCKNFISELKFDINRDFPFNPKHIPKVAQRRIRRACYQSFALYKKSFKPKRLPRFRFIKDEWPWGKHDDHIDAISHLFCDDNFHKQYLASWAQDPEQQVFKGWDGIKGIINRDA